MNIAFYVSGKATRLKKIVDDIRFSKIEKSVKLVFSDNIQKENLTDINKFSSLVIKGIQYDLLDSENKNLFLSQLLLEEFENNKIDYCFSFGDHIFTPNLVDKYKERIINFHPSILPVFPGRKAIDQAFDHQSFLYGNTAHFIDSGIDTGPIIMQNIIHNSQINSVSSYDQILDFQIDMFYQIYEWLKAKRIVVKDGICLVLSSKNSKVTFYPELEIS